MTKAEKFLKDGVSIEELIATMENELLLSYVDVAQFWKKAIKPTLTEDERVILRNTTANNCNAKNHYITRTKGSGRVRIKFKENGEEGYFNFAGFDHLFQFIKERRRILY